MECENCIACKSYWNGNEEETYCEIGISEEEAYHDGKWYCKYNHKTITKRIRNKFCKERKEKNMTVKELITNLLDCPMDANVIVEIPTHERCEYSSSEKIEHCLMIDDERCLISED